MMLPSFFYDVRLRSIILWVTDMLVLFASYLYATNPENLRKSLAKIDLSHLDPEIDPFEMLYPMLVTTTVMAIAIVVVFHTVTFYQSYRRKRAAVAYVKIYSALAAVSILAWVLYNFEGKSMWALIPLAFYTGVFIAEKIPSDKQAQ
jgi:hypothetical protein